MPVLLWVRENDSNPEEATTYTALSGNGHNYNIISAYAGKVGIFNFNTKTFKVDDPHCQLSVPLSTSLTNHGYFRKIFFYFAVPGPCGHSLA